MKGVSRNDKLHLLQCHLILRICSLVIARYLDLLEYLREGVKPET